MPVADAGVSAIPWYWCGRRWQHGQHASQPLRRAVGDRAAGAIGTRQTDDSTREEEAEEKRHGERYSGVRPALVRTRPGLGWVCRAQQPSGPLGECSPAVSRVELALATAEWAQPTPTTPRPNHAHTGEGTPTWLTDVGGSSRWGCVCAPPSRPAKKNLAFKRDRRERRETQSKGDQYEHTNVLIDE